MKALSIKEPWAGMIAAGEKTIETRTWSTKHVGELLIVASLRPRTENSGKAIAVARLVHCCRMFREHERRAKCRMYPGAWAWCLEDIRRITPFHVRGRLGLYDVEIPG